MDFREMHAREISRIPEGYAIHRWEAVGSAKNAIGANLTFGLTDGVRSRGKYKGHTRWKKGAARMDITVFVSEPAHQEWLLAWERKTGHCYECNGTGQEWAGWSAAEGMRYHPCRRCEATGIAPEQPDDKASASTPTEST